MSQSLIFITGATGFIGAHVVAQTLEAGHHVRLSVRKESQISSLKELFAGHESKLDFAVIPDLTKPGAFDQALQGAEYVFHLASPMPGKGSDFKTDYLGPAVEEGANQSIPVDPDMEFPSDPRANAGFKYHASKILAHRAVLEWVPKNQPGFSVVTLHPSFVFGRNLHQKSHDQIDGTNAMLWESLFSEKPLVPMATVDVRDVALAHLKALDLEIKEKATVQEFLLSAPKATGWEWERVASFVREKYPALDIKLKGPFDEPPTVEAKRAAELLGIHWRSMEDTISSFLDQQVELKSQL
ncbi:NAD dependent epimerase/dehydratase [Colletotrichum tabaci]|uniref:NAD dependent epimerase/dehydratase n=1 Tax=Colletotrichum tabaci TaxID=1209068 RepID=A0AAV9SYE0_9PEZI